MNAQDAQTIVAIAALAAMADGNQTDAEQAGISAAAAKFGVSADLIPAPAPSANGPAVAGISGLVGRLSDDEARRAAYETAASVCHSDGELNAKESAFLAALASALGIANAGAVGPTAGSFEAAQRGASALAAAGTAGVTGVPNAVDDATGSATGTPVSVPAIGATPPSAAEPDLDNYILDQAMLAGACELLPNRLANMAILPLQLHLVYTIGDRHGQKPDMAQAKDLAAALGIGAAAQVMEGVVRRTLGGIAGGLLGGLLGGATGVAAGAAVSFAATYALGHAAKQYYAQGRQLSSADLKQLFTRFQGEANVLFPKVEQRVRTLAAGTNITSILGRLRA